MPPDPPRSGRWADPVGAAEHVHEGDGVAGTGARADDTDPGDDPDREGGAEPVTAVPMADVMADMPGVWRRLLAAHVPDRLGRCRGCRSDTGSGERWPCSLHRIASEARRLHDRKLQRAVDTD